MSTQIAPRGGAARLRSLAAAVASVAALTVVGVALIRLGRGPLVPPKHWSAAGIRAWSQERDPVTIALSLMRIVAVGVVGQMAIATGLAGLGTVLRVPWLLKASHLASLPGTRGMVRRLAGLSLSLSAAVTPPPAAAGAPHPVVLERVESSPGARPAVLTRLADAPSAGGRRAERGSAAPVDRTASLRRLPPDRSATLRRLEPEADHEATLTSLDPAPTGTQAEPPPGVVVPGGTSVTNGLPAAAAQPEFWVVHRGDHLWSIAEATLAQTWGRHPTEPETESYWHSVVMANPQISDPDLVFAGQPVRLPPVPTAAH